MFAPAAAGASSVLDLIEVGLRSEQVIKLVAFVATATACRTRWRQALPAPSEPPGVAVFGTAPPYPTYVTALQRPIGAARHPKCHGTSKPPKAPNALGAGYAFVTWL